MMTTVHTSIVRAFLRKLILAVSLGICSLFTLHAQFISPPDTARLSSPVDVIDISSLSRLSAQVSIGQLLNHALASFSSNPQTVADGTDHVDPISLRGLGADQVLILVNGKKRHSSSLVNVNGTVGRGAATTDLNTIPLAAVERIEVIRDGAASARYGSDAVAGVINIVLKQDATPSVVFSSGAHMTDQAEQADGQSNNLQLAYGVPIGHRGGGLYFTGELNHRQSIDRTGAFEGQIFNRYNMIERQALSDGYELDRLPAGVVEYYARLLGFDPSTQVLDEGYDALQSFLNDDVTDSELLARGLSRNDFNLRTGQAELRESRIFANLSLPLSEHTELYAFGGTSFRAGNSAGFYRLPYQPATYTPIYYNGFLPELHSQIRDQSAVLGLKTVVSNWDLDFSHSFGHNSFDYVVDKTLNASLESFSPTSFYAGAHAQTQMVTTLDAERQWEDVFSGLTLTGGLEHRLDHYRILAGDVASYALYDVHQEVVGSYLDLSNSVTDVLGDARPGGAQLFPGFTPANALKRYRSSLGGYGGIRVRFRERWMADLLLRYDHFGEQGGGLSYRFSGTYQVVRPLMLRFSAGSGLRAPSMSQLYFIRVATRFTGSTAVETGIFANDSRASELLGFAPLKPERTSSFSAGTELRMVDNRVRLSLDAFRITVFDRITLTGPFTAGTGSADAALRALLRQAGAASASFFANSTDLRSEGVELVLNYSSGVGAGELLTSVSATLARTMLTGDLQVPEELSGREDAFLSDFERILLTAAAPRSKVHAGIAYELKRFSLYFNGSWFGAVTHPGLLPEDQTLLLPRFLADAALSWQMASFLNITVGANNLFDTYPVELGSDNPDYSLGRFRYSRNATQFGFGGRFLFVRLGVRI